MKAADVGNCELFAYQKALQGQFVVDFLGHFVMDLLGFLHLRRVEVTIAQDEQVEHPCGRLYFLLHHLQILHYLRLLIMPVVLLGRLLGR